MKTSFNTSKKTISIPSIRISWLHLVLFLVLILWFNSCQSERALEGELATIEKVKNNEIILYKTALGENAATRLSYQGETQSLKAFLEASRDSTKMMKRLAKKYKSISAGVQSTTATVINDIEVPYVVPNASFSVPFSINKKYYSLSGVSSNLGLIIDTLSIYNNQSILIGKKKSGFFSNEFRVDVVNSNPYVQTTSVESFVHREKKKRAGISVFVGYGINKDGISPTAGVGFTYDLIRF